MKKIFRKPLVYLLAVMMVFPTWLATGLAGVQTAKAVAHVEGGGSKEVVNGTKIVGLQQLAVSFDSGDVTNVGVDVKISHLSSADLVFASNKITVTPSDNLDLGSGLGNSVLITPNGDNDELHIDVIGILPTEKATITFDGISVKATKTGKSSDYAIDEHLEIYSNSINPYMSVNFNDKIDVDAQTPSFSLLSINSSYVKYRDEVRVGFFASESLIEGELPSVEIDGNKILVADNGDGAYVGTWQVDDNTPISKPISINISGTDVNDNDGATIINGILTLDNTRPVISSYETADRNQNGKIDAIKVRFNEKVNYKTINPADFAINGYGQGISLVNKFNADYAIISLNEVLVNDSGNKPVVVYAANPNGPIVDLAGNAIDTLLSNNVPTSDMASPVATITSASSLSISPISFNVAFSEPVMIGSFDKNAISVNAAYSDYITLSEPASSDGGKTFSFQLTVTPGAENFGDISIAIVPQKIKDQSGNTAIGKALNVNFDPRPVITLNGGNNIIVDYNSVFTDPGFNAVDNENKALVATLTGSVDTAILGNYVLNYSATDEKGYSKTVVRVVRVVDRTAPVITLSGDSSVTLNVGSTYTDAGATATDNYDKTIAVVATGSVDTKTAGTYVITYTAKDSNGNVSTKTRTVKVVAPVVVNQETPTVRPSSAKAAPNAPAPAENKVETPTGDENGIIKGSDDTDETKDEINWTPWIVLFILIILAGAATGGYFYWFADKDSSSEVEKTKVIEEKEEKNTVQAKVAVKENVKTKKNRKRW